MNELRYILKMSRPRFWLYLAGPALVGMVFGASNPSELLTPLNLFLFLYFLIPANIMLYGINDYFDRDVDEENPKKDEKEAKWQPGKLTDGTVLASAVLSLGLLVLPQITWIWSAAFLFLSLEYSAPPLRFKIRPFLDSISNGLYLMPFVISFTAVNGSIPPLSVIAGGWLWTMAMHTFSAIPDIEPDRKAGIDTTATFLGRKRTLMYCSAVWMLSMIVFGFYSRLLAGLFAVYPVLIGAIVLMDIDVGRAYWWYPYINAAVGMVITLHGLRVLFGV